MTTTEQVIDSMLKENTGRSILDSGGYYGRNWQQNQGRDFNSEPSSTLSFQWGEIDLTHNIYHWLINRLDYDDGADIIFNEWAKRDENSNESWFELIYKFMDYLREEWIDYDAGLDLNGQQYKVYPEITGLYGDGEPIVVNSYNGESLVSQTIQFTYFTVEDSNILASGIYVLLQIHGGCDVRGGYTQPRMFIPNGIWDETSIFIQSGGTIFCPSCDAGWETDDAYNYYCRENWDGGSQSISNHEIVDMSEYHKATIAAVAKAHAGLNQVIEGMGDHMKRYLVADEHKGWCPVCGEALLEGADY